MYSILRSIFSCVVYLTVVSTSFSAGADTVKVDGGSTSSVEVQEASNAIEASNACMHWAGEIGDQSPERNAEIAKGVDNDCPKAQQLLENAFAKYPKNERLYETVLSMHDMGRMNISPSDIQRLCLSLKNWPGCE